ncbi:hypothetical protein FAGAP_8838 [Fusarium agapanthi]|uniref:Uncharacterized protein n=1 Tax=Fusarium agapanthi TaxID=1803897 RepID=A0A9P5B3C2_9HYPO|nr:hypothetical protein FAGAP_8838 [Fusarium agapanthi]
MWLRLPGSRHEHLNCPAILMSRNEDEGQGYMVFPGRDIFCVRTTDWKSLPQHFEDCKTSLPFFGPFYSSMVSVRKLAIEFDSSWNVELPKTLGEVKAENSARGLVATWIEGVASGWVNAPQLYLIDKGTLLVQKTRGYSRIYHDCDGKYTSMRDEWYNDAIYAFIAALDELLPFEEYGQLYQDNNPDSWDEDLGMWLGFNVFSKIQVLARFEYANQNEISWTAVCNDSSDDDEKGSEKAISAYGRVYDLEYDDDVGYCIGDWGNSNNGWFSLDGEESGNDDERDRVEYVKDLWLDLEKVETRAGDE